MTKRICLFAGYDLEGKIDDYVIYYCKELSKMADVYYLGDFNSSDKELEKLEGITKGAYAFRHKKYDFGSWQELVKLIGKEKIREYDELILANDSCFGPLYSLDNVFKEMDTRDCDFWGLSSSRGYHIHIQSYFLVFKKSVINDNTLFDFLHGVKAEKSLADVCTNYEERITYVLSKKGFKFSTYIPYGDFINQPYYNTTNAITNKKFPLLKVKTFYGEVGFEPIKNWEKLISDHSSYDIKLIKNNLYRRGLDDEQISQKVYYGKRISKKVKLIKFIKSIIKGFLKILSWPIRKYVYHFVDFKLEQVVNSFNYRIDELTRQIKELEKRLISTNANINEDIDYTKKYDIINDNKKGYKDYFLSDDYFVFREMDNIILNFDRYGKDILFIGNFEESNINDFDVLNNKLIITNSKNINKNSNFYKNYVYNINDITSFELLNNKNNIYFDLILIEPFAQNVKQEDIIKILSNLYKQMIPESILVINIKYNEVSNINKIVKELSFEIDEDAIRMYGGKIVSKIGYSVLFFRKKREYDKNIQE